MSRKRAPMRKIKEVLRLAHLGGFGEREIGDSVRLKKTTVHDYLTRAKEAGLLWEKAKDLEDAAIEERLFPTSSSGVPGKPLPDWGVVHKELRRKGVTLQLLWEEYREVHPDGYGYSRFCELYQNFSPRFDLSMRQVHKAGEKLFVDYSGLTIDIIDRQTGECLPAQIFVAVMGASNYAYAEATWTQKLFDWTGSHVRALRYFGGVPAVFVPDNLRSGVTKAWFYDPEINRTYQGLASHYGVVVLPARAAHPKDKAKVEVAVQVVQRWILARLRHRQFFSVPEANEAIGELLEKLNERPFRKLPGCRRSLFEELDKPALKPLPLTPYEFDEWKTGQVGFDYHIEWDEHHYSVSYQLAKKDVDIRATANMVEVFHRGKLVAIHPRSRQKNGYSTRSEHMPATHRAWAEWTPKRVITWAAKAGEHVAAYVKHLMASRPHPEQGFRSSLGIIRLGKKVGDDRLNAACQRALAFGGETYRCVSNILDRGQDRLPLPEPSGPPPIVDHQNLRGPAYFATPESEDTKC